jgi:uncharacterized protein YbjT (DUF2867 family)
VRILVTGAGGFVGAQLIPHLLADGQEVRALGRTPARVQETLELLSPGDVADSVEIFRGDALTGAGLGRALEQVEVAYYLIHSMERSVSKSPFAERESAAAHTFAAAAAKAGVRRVVYLGGLMGTDPARASRHLSSREAVERILLQSIPDSVALRASIVIGARSRSFRLLVHLVERLRVLALPAWRRYRTQPIDARDVTAMLLASATAPAVSGLSMDIGGPDVLSYGEMVTRIAELMLVNRPAFGVAVSATPLTARVVAAIVGEDPELMMPLMESLEGDLLSADKRAAKLLDVRLHSFDSAVEHALGEWEESEPLAAR